MDNENEIKRAIYLMRVAADYIFNEWPDGISEYDDTECDGYCLSEDLRTAADMLDGGESND